MSEFKYPDDVDLDEILSDGELRYGRLRQRAFRHMKDKAPFCEDGALYDRLNPGRPILPVNVVKKKEVTVHPATCTVEVVEYTSTFDPTPGAGVYGDVGN